MVKKTALSLFKGEWVVFTEKEHEEEKSSHDEHDHNAHKDEAEHEGEGHEEQEEHEEAPYTAKVVEIIAYVGDDVAIKGLKANEEYVSEGVYFVKSMILKSSLGEHGH